MTSSSRVSAKSPNPVSSATPKSCISSKTTQLNCALSTLYIPRLAARDVVAELIERTVKVKAYHVSSDLKEKGLREFLNYGHTMGHAIEKLEHFRWRHGNAVAVGMVYAAELAHLIGYIDQDLVDYHRSLLASMGLPTSWNGGSFDDVLALMHRDKKARGNELRFVVLERLVTSYTSTTRPPKPWKKHSVVSSSN